MRASPVRGDVLEQAIALRAMGWMNKEIAAHLSKQLGRLLTTAMVSSALTRAKEPLPAQSVSKGQLPDADVKTAPSHEAKPTVEIRAPERSTTGSASTVSVHTSKSRAEAYLIISDLQIPYHHPGALEFCKKVRFEFGIPLENVLCVGDETDAYWGSRFEKSVDAPHTAEQEIHEARKELARWVVAFPQMRLCNSNHGGRWAKLASRVGVPRSMLRDYRELLGTPQEWRWADHWVVSGSKQRFRVEHGHWKPGGHSGLRTRSLFRGMSTAWGHEHAEPATMHIDTYGQSVWSMRVGSLITKEPVPAFEYNTEDSYRPTASVGVVLDGGRLPLVVRM